MTHNDNMPEWDELQDIWQDSPAVDMTKLARHARFVWWRMRLNFALEVLLCLSGVGFFGYEVLAKPFSKATYFNVFFILVCLAGVWAAVYIRRGAWGKPDGTALSLVELQIHRAQSAIRYIRINNWGSLIGVPIFGLAYWSIWDRVKGASFEQMLPLYVVTGVAASIFILFPLLTRSYVARKKRQIMELEAIAQQLRSDDGGDES